MTSVCRMVYIFLRQPGRVIGSWAVLWASGDPSTVASLILPLLSSVGTHCSFSDLGSFSGMVPRRLGIFLVLQIKWASNLTDKDHSLLGIPLLPYPQETLVWPLAQGSLSQVNHLRNNFLTKVFYLPRYSWFLFQSIYGFYLSIYRLDKFGMKNRNNKSFQKQSWVEKSVESVSGLSELFKPELQNVVIRKRKL